MGSHASCPIRYSLLLTHSQHYDLWLAFYVRKPEASVLPSGYLLRALRPKEGHQILKPRISVRLLAPIVYEVSSALAASCEPLFSQADRCRHTPEVSSRMAPIPFQTDGIGEVQGPIDMQTNNSCKDTQCFKSVPLG